MATIKTYIDIHATPEVVWRVLTDFAAYREWNPFIRVASGRARERERLRLRVTLPRGRAKKFTAVVMRAIPAAELCWRERRLIHGVFDREHSFIIVPQGMTGVRLIQREQFAGLLEPLLFPLIEAKTTKAFQLMNAALKKVAEGKH